MPDKLDFLETDIHAEHEVSVQDKIKSKLPADSPVSCKRTAYRFIKRTFDIVFSAISIVLLFPFMCVVALLIKADSDGPVLFRQTRVGKNGKLFTIYKFRSMCIDAEKQLGSLKKKNEKDGPIFKIEDDPRITKIGRVLRRTSIDELPQLFNILHGDMAFVGPRPPLPSEVLQYNDYQMQRVTIKPGLTCYWQVQGRSNIGFDEWVRLDIKYIQECGILTDIKILLRTVSAVIRRDGAY